MGTTSFAPIFVGISRRPHACYRRLRSETLQRTLRRDDDRAYETLTTRQGVTPFAMGADAEWSALADATRTRLVTGNVLPRALLDRAATFR